MAPEPSSRPSMARKPAAGASSSSSFVDDSTECAICFEPLEGNGSSTVITLRCGHKWHLNCIIRQIEVGSMTASNDDKRLLFNGCQCGKCGSIFGEDDHPDLPRDLLRSTDKLRSKVNALIDEHKLLEGLCVAAAAAAADAAGSHQPPPQRQTEALYAEARRKYAFYLCCHCRDPYFGGTIECADGLRAPAVRPETRLCPACAPQSQTICQNPTEHGRYLVWKCRYCCKPSTTVCYGNVHFCEDCHDQHSKRQTTAAAALVARPCLGGDACPYPKPTGSDGNPRAFHSNGASPDCEQVYSCVLCDSVKGAASSLGSSSSGGDALAIEAGSRNFLTNPSGEGSSMEGWRQLNPRMSWAVEAERDRRDQIIPPLLQTPVLGRNDADGRPLRPPIATNFVSSFLDCAMAQTVDLGKVLKLGNNHPANASNNNNNNTIPRVIRIEVSARYTGRTDCPSVFGLQAILSESESSFLRAARNQPRRLSSGTLEAPPGVYWERTSLEFQLDPTEWTAPVVTVIVLGKDRRFWRGAFGSKVADITLRVVGATAEELDALLVHPRGEDNDDDDDGNRENEGSAASASAADGSMTGLQQQQRTKQGELLTAFVILGVLLAMLFSKGS